MDVQPDSFGQCRDIRSADAHRGAIKQNACRCSAGAQPVESKEMDSSRIPGRSVAALTTAAAVALAIGCQRPARHYQLKGQIVAVDPARQELTIKHQDIPGFMPGMTMAFKVWEPRLID